MRVKAKSRLDLNKAETIAKGLRKAPMVANVVGFARSNEELVATVAQWDRRRLPARDASRHRRSSHGKAEAARGTDEYITKVTAVAPASAGTTRADLASLPRAHLSP